MAIAVTCEKCGVRLRFKGEHAGRNAKCRSCGEQLVVQGETIPDHDIFISYSHKDKHVADAACAALEAKRIRCWIAPRDVLPGKQWAGAILDAIGDARVMVLIYSAHSNASPQVLREVDRAVSRGVIIIPFRIESAEMCKEMEYYIAAAHWLDAMDGKMDEHIGRLVSSTRSLLASDAGPIAPARQRLEAASKPKHSWLAAASLCVSVFAVMAIGIMAWRMNRPASPPPAMAPALTISAPSKPAEPAVDATQWKTQFITQLLATAQSNDSPEKGRNALAALDEILMLDPGNAQATALHQKITAYYAQNDIGAPPATMPTAADLAARKTELVGQLLATARTNDSPEKGRDALAALDEALMLDPGNAEATALHQKISGYYLQPEVPTPDQMPMPPPLAAEPIDLNKGLVLHFSFDASPVDGVVKDESGNGNDGHVSGAKWTYETDGHGALSFSAADGTDAVAVPDSPSLDVDQITESAWIKTSTTNQWWRRIIDKDWSTGFDLTMVGGDWSGDWKGKTYVFSSKPVADGGWHHVAATYDGAAMRLYVDGTQQSASTNWYRNVGNNTHVLRIGNGDLDSKQSDGTPNILAFDGEIRQVRIYNRALSPAEIAALRDQDQATSPAPSPSPPVAVESPTFTNSLGMKLVRIQPGTFMMGSPVDEPDRSSDETQHQVTLTHGFYMGSTPVIVGQFAAFVKETGYRTDAEVKGSSFGWFHQNKALNGPHDGMYWRSPGFAQPDNNPVVDVSWNDATTFCKWLSGKEQREYRLPTEAEWEYACRAGTQTAFYFGDDDSILADYAWFKTDGVDQPCPVGGKKPNAWGLYDMVGNVWQWCGDQYSAYPDGPVTDPVGPTVGNKHQVRGGGWYNGAKVLRSASRWSAGGPPDERRDCWGFRVVMQSQ